MITVKSAQKENGAKILNISEKTRVFNKTELSCVKELWDDYLTKGPDSGYNFLISEMENKVTGFICYGAHALTEGAYDMYWIAVDPVYQHRGIGRELVKKVEEEIRNLNGSLLIAETSSTPVYQPARDFYQNNGFDLEATVHDFYALDDHLLIYTKHIYQKPTKQQKGLLEKA